MAEQGRQAEEKLQEVHSLREPARAGYHCGQLMKKFAAPNSKGGVTQVRSCEKCGFQERPVAVQ
jgi:hypothetical protein